MQPYRAERPHDPAECQTCGPTRPGHQLCQHDSCDELAEAQHRRHATAEEFAALPEAFQPIDGVAYQAVFSCYDHEVGPICGDGDHGMPANDGGGLVEVGGMHGADSLTVLRTATGTGPCPQCGAAADEPCVKADGNPRTAPHRDRGADAGAVQVPTAVCDHVHRPDCRGLGRCVCRADDPAPDRPRRIVPPPLPPGLPPMHVGVAGPFAEFLGRHGIDMDRVMTLSPTPGPDGTMLLEATMIRRDAHGAPIFDVHGRPDTETVTVPFRPLPPDLRTPPDDHAAAAV
jgi:hypothetical protein